MDLLKQKLVRRVDFERSSQRPKALDVSAAYQHIGEAIREARNRPAECSRHPPMAETLPQRAKRIAANLVIERRGALDMLMLVGLTGAFIWVAQSHSFKAVLSTSGRSALYISLAATGGALLGSMLTALAILVALPSTGRMRALQEHPNWDRVPGAFFRAAWALLAVLVVATLGIVIDAGAVSAKLYMRQ